jgi:hypothetical protein
MSVSTVGGSGDAGSHDLPPAPAPGGHRLSPKLLAYLMGPAAFVAILILMHLGYIARESAWVWLGVFVAIPLANVIVDRQYDTRPSAVTLNLRVMSQITAVTAVIFLSGWGPVLWGLAPGGWWHSGVWSDWLSARSACGGDGCRPNCRCPDRRPSS